MWLIAIFRFELSDIFLFPCGDLLFFFSGALWTAGLEVFVDFMILGSVKSFDGFWCNAVLARDKLNFLNVLTAFVSYGFYAIKPVNICVSLIRSSFNELIGFVFCMGIQFSALHIFTSCPFPNRRSSKAQKGITDLTEREHLVSLLASHARRLVVI